MATNASLAAALQSKKAPPGSTPWWTDQEAQNPNVGGAGADYTQVQNLPTSTMGMSPQYLQALQAMGYQGGSPNTPEGYQALQQFIQQRGLTSKTSFLDQKGTGDQISALFDANGNQAPGTQRQYASDVNSDAFMGGILGGAGFAGAAAAGLGAGAAGGGSAGLSSADTAALYGDAGYGGGGGGFGATGSGGFSLGGANAQVLSDAQMAQYGNMPSFMGGADGAGGVGLAEGGTPGSLAGGGSGLSGLATNSTLADSAAGTPGYGASSAGGGGGVGDLSGISGPTTGSSMSTNLQNMLQGQGGQGLSGLGKGLVGLGASALTGGLGGGNTGMLNSVDYQKAATAQGQSARTDQVNSQGQMQYKQTGTDAQGNPTYTQTSSLNAPFQANLDKAVGNQGTALNNLSSYNNGLPGAYSKVPGLYGDAGSQAGLVKQAQDAAYNSQTSYLDPQYAQLQKQLQAQLANQGVTYGSDAYNAANTQFGSQQNQAYGTARDSAIAQGDTYANTLFNQNLAAHQQGMADINNQGTNYANQSSGALSGVVQNPQFAATPPATNYLGAAQLQGGANLNQYNAKIGNTNNLTNGLTGIGTAVAGNPSFWSGLGGLFSGG